MSRIGQSWEDVREAWGCKIEEVYGPFRNRDEVEGVLIEHALDALEQGFALSAGLVLALMDVALWRDDRSVSVGNRGRLGQC